MLQMRGKGGGTIASSEQGDYPLRPALVIAYRGADPAPTYTPRPSEDLDQALQQAARTNRPLVMRFYMETCGICKKVEATTFKDDRVIKAMAEMLVVKVDAERHVELANTLGIESVPAILVVEPDGKTVRTRIEAREMMQPETLLPKLTTALKAVAK
jgi:thiol:disulfide interchange protein